MDREQIKIHPVNTIVIANIHEYYQWLFPYFDAWEVKAWKWIDHAESDMALFWGGDNKLIIHPFFPNINFVSHTLEQMRYQNVRVVSPQRATESICRDILDDHSLFNMVVETIKASSSPEIIAWGATPELYTLVEALNSKGAEVSLSEFPERESLWTVRQFDSKVGFRELCMQLRRDHPQVRVTSAVSFASKTLASHALPGLLRYMPHGIVVKSENSLGGYGVLVYDNTLKDNPDFVQFDFEGQCRDNCIWQTGQVVIEEYICTIADEIIRSPTVQMRINDAGCQIQCIVGQRIEGSQHYIGSIIAPSLFPPDLEKKLTGIAHIIGQSVFESGYRGHCDLDFVVDDSLEPVCVEMNVRRTSITYALELGQFLLGDGFLNSFTILTAERFHSRSLFGVNYEALRSMLTDLLFPLDGQKCGIVLSIVSSLQYFVGEPKLGFVIVGRSYEEAQDLYKALITRIERGKSEHKL